MRREGKVFYGTAAGCKTVEIKAIDRRKPEPAPLEDRCKTTLTQQTIIDMFGPETGFTGFFRFSSHHDRRQLLPTRARGGGITCVTGLSISSIQRLIHSPHAHST